MTQLPLPIHQIDDEDFANFYSNNNLLLLNSVRRNFKEIKQPFFYLWGETGSGKTHFLKACINEYLRADRRAIYVPLSKSCYFSPAVLENLEHQELVCLDDLQAVIGNIEWEVAIFDLFNRIKENQKTLLIMAATQSPSHLPITLPDLASRLTWGEIYQLANLDEEQKRHILQRNARQRGVELPDETANFLLKRMDRDLKTLSQTLLLLDKASLQAKRKLTIPFVKEVLKL